MTYDLGCKTKKAGRWLRPTLDRILDEWHPGGGTPLDQALWLARVSLWLMATVLGGSCFMAIGLGVQHHDPGFAAVGVMQLYKACAFHLLRCWLSRLGR